MPQLITSSHIARITKFDKFGKAGNLAGWILMHLLGLKKLNRVYKQIKDLQGVDFIEAVIEKLNIEIDIPEEDLKRIPETGSFITVSNHPLGGLDGILLLAIILKKRPDYKVLNSFLLDHLPQLQNFLFELNQGQDSLSDIDRLLNDLAGEKSLGLFPSGEVSTYKKGKLVVDKSWNKEVLKLISSAKVPVIPVYFHGRNTRLFNFLSRLYPPLRTAKLPSEDLFNSKKKIQVRIGKPIKPKVQESFSNTHMLAEFIRKKTYILAKPFEKKSSSGTKQNFTIQPEVKKIVEPVSVEKLLEDIKRIEKKGNRIFEKNEYITFLSDAKDIPFLLREIGRLREITFRAIGEGTGKEIDLDKYDKYYKHLILWDQKNNRVVGAYRMGLGREIYEKYGIKGFYLSELFTFEPELHEMMSKAIEMGRAFIVKEYQQKPFPLFLLWRGIVHTTLRYPDHEYLIGPVSISNRFSNFSKSLIIEFMKSYFYDPYTAQYVRPNKAFKVRLNEEDKTFIFNTAGDNLSQFDKIIDELEPENLKIPVLLKKYIKQNARLIAFNVDPNFNNAIDGLMYIKISDLPEETVKPVLEEFEKQLISD